MSRGLTSTAAVTIHAPAADVWDALTTPAAIKQYMFGADVMSEWKEGSPITWKGEYDGRAYEDKGVVLTLQPERLLRYSHYSPLSGQPDVPESYHTITVELSEHDASTDVRLSQDNNPTEEARDHTAQFWQAMLERLQQLLEQ
ncbi:MAG: SRPBCC family protein [Chloroflexota bacterium]